MEDKFKIQDDLYVFPYHYIPHFDTHGIPHIHRELSWGWDYLTYMSYSIEYIIQNIQVGQSIIDIGCGDGFLLNQLSVDGIKKLGIDLSDKAIRFAKAFNSNTTFRKQTIYEINQQFDLVILNEVMEHISNEEISEFMNHIKKLVKNNGKLLITVPSLDIPVNKKHFRHYNLDLVKEELNDPHFQVEHYTKLSVRSKNLRRIQWLLNNRFYLIKNRKIIKYFWGWHIRNTFKTNSKKANHIFVVFRKGEK